MMAPQSVSSKSMKRNLLEQDESFVGGGSNHVQPRGRAATCLILTNYMIGSGILNQPSVFSSAGVLGASLLYVVGAFTLWVGIVLLNAVSVLKAPPESGKIETYGYTELGRDSYGQWGGKITDFCVGLRLYLAALTYILLMGSIASDLLEIWTGTSTAITSFYFTCPLLTAVVVFPACLLRHLTEALYLSFIGLGAVVVVLLLLIIEGPQAGASDREDAGPLLVLDFPQMCQKLGSVIYSLSCATAVFHAYAGLRPQTPRDFRQVSACAQALGSALCFATGLIGYLCFRENTEASILDNFEGTPTAVFSRIFLLVHLIFYTPNEFIIMRQHVVSLFAPLSSSLSSSSGYSPSQPFIVHASITFLLLASMVVLNVILVALALSEGSLFGVLLDLGGGLTGSMVCLVLPGFFYLKADPGGMWALAANFSIFFGAVALLSVAIATIFNLSLS